MFAVYILASERNGTLYVGHTDNLNRRVWEHQIEGRPGFTSKYAVKKLVYYEYFETRAAALARERALKKWYRIWKLRLIEEANPDWRDLAEMLQPR